VVVRKSASAFLLTHLQGQLKRPVRQLERQLKQQDCGFQALSPGAAEVGFVATTSRSSI
ncbi:unnamed protein product, partial [Closterium sp. NIES-54]